MDSTDELDHELVDIWEPSSSEKKDLLPRASSAGFSSSSLPSTRRSTPPETYMRTLFPANEETTPLKEPFPVGAHSWDCKGKHNPLKMRPRVLDYKNKLAKSPLGGKAPFSRTLSTLATPISSPLCTFPPETRRRKSEPTLSSSPVTLIPSGPNIRGDGLTCVLPVVPSPSSRADIKIIHPSTLHDLLSGHYDHLISKFLIVDCRYPYEYEAGHIQSAINLWNLHDAETFFFGASKEQLEGHLSSVIVFHCEFSSQRAPAIIKHIRGIDRQIHLDQYPSLFFPEMYMLEGGFNAFFPLFPTACTPSFYLSMFSADHKEQCLKYKRLAKQSQEDNSKSRKHNPHIQTLMAQFTLTSPTLLVSEINEDDEDEEDGVDPLFSSVRSV